MQLPTRGLRLARGSIRRLGLRSARAAGLRNEPPAGVRWVHGGRQLMREPLCGSGSREDGRCSMRGGGRVRGHQHGNVACLAITLLGGCAHYAPDGAAEQPQASSQVADVAYDAIVALEPPRRRAEAEGDEASAERIAIAMSGLLILFDEQTSDAALRRFVELGYLNLGTHDSETYDCIGIRKGQALVPFLEQELRQGSNRCFNEMGQESQICASQKDSDQRFRFLLSEIQRDPHCELVE